MSIQEKDLSELWELALKIIQPDVKKLSFDNILRNSSLESLEGNRAMVRVQNDFSKDWLSTRYMEKLEDALRNLVGSYCRIEFTVGDALPAEDHARPKEPQRDRKPRTREADSSHASKPHHDGKKSFEGRPLREDLVFDRYHVGSYNELAYRYIEDMLEGTDKHPVLIYSSVGMGKTHLLQAAAHRMKQLHPDAKVAYISSEDFVNMLMSNLSDKTMSSFRDTFRQLDMLLIDDIQFLENKKATQDELFFTYNTILEEGKLMILSSDRHPGFLDIQERLRSRMKNTRVAEIRATTYEDRFAIQQKWADFKKLRLPSYFFDKAASRITESIRDLEGAFVNVTSRANMSGWQNIDPETVDAYLDDFAPGTRKKTMTVSRIQNVVARYFKVNPDDLNGASRVKPVSEARQFAMFICREALKMPLESIGREFGGRDHATVLHSCKKVKEAIDKGLTAKTSYNEIMDDLKV